MPQAIPFIDPREVQGVLMQGLLKARAVVRSAMTPYSCRKMSGDVELLEASEWSLTDDQRLRLEGWFQQSLGILCTNPCAMWLTKPEAQTIRT